MSIRPQVEWFSSIMEDKLSKNEHKICWTHDSIDSLLYRIFDEVKELDVEIVNRNYKNIIKECADVANFCMMIADVANRKIK